MEKKVKIMLYRREDYPSWDDVLNKIDQTIELIRLMRKEKQFFRKAYEKAKR